MGQVKLKLKIKIKKGLFIDNYLDSQDLIKIFKDYFEDNSYLKVWHNYGFDRHVIYHEGINVK